MAILNIKDFPDELYARLQERAGRERRSVAQEVIHLLETSVPEAGRHSLLDLRGLGKDLWQGIDGADHVRRERDAWD